MERLTDLVRGNFDLRPYGILKMLDLIRGITQQTGKTGGLVFISGATGSGKSTTQYTMACGFRRDAMNIITVEDPVEYILPFAKQIQLQALVKQKAIDLERSILRQDPDILIFGEIRDAVSARAALAFAESGHLVISTIHANSAADALPAREAGRFGPFEEEGQERDQGQRCEDHA